MSADLCLFWAISYREPDWLLWAEPETVVQVEEHIAKECPLSDLHRRQLQDRAYLIGTADSPSAEATAVLTSLARAATRLVR